MVIVTGNSEAAIGACLDAALATGAEVVVDRASTDRTRWQVPGRPAAGGKLSRKQSRLYWYDGLLKYSARHLGRRPVG